MLATVHNNGSTYLVETLFIDIRSFQTNVNIFLVVLNNFIM
ncbi:MAG: hypothetical protein ACI4RJ_00825 [Alphaproteobacteria bacterium]